MDIDFLLALQGLRETTGQALDGFFSIVTKLGGSTVMALLIALTYWCVDKRGGVCMMIGCSLSLAVSQWMKAAVCAYRPWIRDARITPIQSALASATGYSFPSGHTTNAAALYTALALRHRKRWWACALFILAVALVAFSRNYLGVHTPQDVLVGLVVGVGCAILAPRLLSWLEGQKRGDWYELFGGVSIGIALLLYTACKSYPADYVQGELLVDPVVMTTDAFTSVGAILGFAVGGFWEKRSVGFSAAGSFAARSLRFVAGAILLLALNQTVKPLANRVLGVQWGGLFFGCLGMLYVSVLYPMLFSAVRRFAQARGGERRGESQQRNVNF